MIVNAVQESAADALSTIMQAPPPVWRGFIDAWFGFADWRLMVRLTVGIVASVLLASTIAFHPRTHGNARTVAELEHPATLLFYAVIGVVVAQIVAVQPAMAFVVFGIGGLLRFRTDVGEAVDTGQVILVTVVGVACGLQQYPLGVLATVVGWLLIYRLRGTRPYAFLIEDLEPDAVEEVAEDVNALLATLGFVVIRRSLKPRKGRVRFLVRGPIELAQHEFEARVLETSHTGNLQFEWDD
jgi:hypothetical protein